ncbi:MAG TPA: type V CRISPR-associated protein Cas12b [Anaerohalosphaeraceae bacterium]|nr:type V CRISPR-associated protein Cas12b [Anaerohalosphaeraceae bacterium]
MATKTINLKMVIDRSDKPQAKELRQALWTTHEELNKAVAEIERILLLCRGRSYFISGKDKDGKDVDIEVKAGTVQKQALDLARSVQKKNGKANTGSDDEILKALQQLYEALVPSVLLDKKGEPLKGDSQSVGNSFARPLMRPDPNDGPFPDIAQKVLVPTPLWIREITSNSYDACNPNHGKYKIEDSESEYYFEVDPEKANQWAHGEGARYIDQMDHVSGAKNAWLKKYKDGKHSEWPMLLAKNQFEIKHDVRIFIREQLWRELGLLPLFPPIFKDFKWNSLAVRLAVAHLLTWESWNHRCRKEYNELSVKVNEKQNIISGLNTAIIAKIRSYESERQKALKKHSLSTDNREFKINPRMLRAFNRVKEVWSKNNCLTQEAREDALAAIQTELRGKFGDPDFYLWLAKDENITVWQNDDNPLYEVAQLNALSRLLAQKKQQSLYTQPDAIKHPKWAQFEPPCGTNLKNYELIQNSTQLSIKLPLLCKTADGICEKEFTIRLAASGQIHQPEIVTGDQSKLTFFYADEQYAADLGGSDILFDRAFLENRELPNIQDGNIGSVWFKLVLTVEPKAPAGWIDDNGRLKNIPEISHFKSGLLNKRHKDSIEAGLRVLSVDLGVRTFASCSVFELVKGKPQKGLHWCADKDKDLWAKHERSFTLTMPGDDISAKSQEARYKAYEEMSEIKQGKNFIRNLLRISMLDDIEKRTKEFNLLCSGKDKFTGKDLAYKLSNEETVELQNYLQKPLEVWQHKVKMCFDKYEKKVSNAVSKWRKETKSKKRHRLYEMGKSYWGIEYLEGVRDFLKGWSTHAREYGKITRWNREGQGTFANSLLSHINNKKEDRIKTGADLIIQSARGKVYNKKEKKWQDRFQPCRLVLFEDLAMYRFRTDRPRRENSQLMRWSHRAIIDEVKQQAAIYGVHVETTGAGFSSKFYAKNGCPGIRVKKLTKADIDYINKNERIKKHLIDEGFAGESLKEGCFIPWQGGEFFASFSDKGKLEIIHADINAAQNLQRRFWTRFADIFRVPVKQIDVNGNQWIPQGNGERLKGGLSIITNSNGMVIFEKDGDGFKAQKRVGRKPKADAAEDAGGLDEFAEKLIELDVDLENEEAKGHAVFFRDASGIVLNKDCFYMSKSDSEPHKGFWSRVYKAIAPALKERNRKYLEKNESTPF